MMAGTFDVGRELAEAVADGSLENAEVRAADECASWTSRCGRDDSL
jgi:hypothetical protein